MLTIGNRPPFPEPSSQASGRGFRHPAPAGWDSGRGLEPCPQPGQAITRPLSTSRPHTRIDGGGVLDRHRGRELPRGK